MKDRGPRVAVLLPPLRAGWPSEIYSRLRPGKNSPACQTGHLSHPIEGQGPPGSRLDPKPEPGLFAGQGLQGCPTPPFTVEIAPDRRKAREHRLPPVLCEGRGQSGVLGSPVQQTVPPQPPGSSSPPSRDAPHGESRGAHSVGLTFFTTPFQTDQT